MRVVLISTYELGRQPFGLASPAAWLRRAGAEVRGMDLSRESLREEVVRGAGLIAFHVPMHTAARLAVELIGPVRELNPLAHLCFYGLYAPVNEAYLRERGVESILGGEFEQGLTDLLARLERPAESSPATQREPVISLARQNFIVPDRAGLVPLAEYARVIMPGGKTRIVGYTEASRGCKHLCRHCPIVPVYNGVFRVVARDVVIEDVRQQAAAGAQHITFGDPDFFNGVGHALPLVEELHRNFPHVTYDVTIKVQHLLEHARHLAMLRDTGCLFVVSAVESLDDAVLERLEKNHTRDEFLRVARLFREVGLVLQPTFLPFTPWTTLDNYCELLETLRAEDLAENVAPIQLAIRLLIPSGSRMLELEEVRDLVEPFDRDAMVYPWVHPDPRVDQLCEQVQKIVHTGEKLNRTRRQIFERVYEAAREAAGFAPPSDVTPHALPLLPSRATVPYLNEPWYC